MKKYSKKNKLVLLLILVLMISVGYAAIASTLKINGNSIVKGLNWSIYWDNVVPTTGSVSGANVVTAPSTTGTTTTEVDFAVILPEPGDYYEFEVDAVNAGTIDAMIANNGIITKAYSDANYTTEVQLPDVVRYTVTYADGTAVAPYHLLAKKSGNNPTRETYKVRVEYRNDDEIDPEDLDSVNDRQYYLRFQVEYVQADNSAIPPRSTVHYITRKNVGQITPGDVIGIGETEDFYVISSDAQKTVLLAKYNLLVGGIYEDWSIVGQVQPTDPGYGLQSAYAIAYDGGFDCAGFVPFSSTNYWDNGDNEHRNLLDPYNENDTIYWDSNSWRYKYRSDNTEAHPYVYDNNSNIYQYISGQNGYINRLKKMGAPSTITGRLLTYEEADAVKEVNKVEISEYIYNSIIVNGQVYWLGSIGEYFGTISIISSYGAIFSAPDYEVATGVRPVIEIPTSDIPTE